MIILRSVVYFIKVVTSAYLRSGGDGYTMLKDPLFVHPGDLAVNHVIEYMKKHTPLITPVEVEFLSQKKSRVCHLKVAFCIRIIHVF